MADKKRSFKKLKESMAYEDFIKFCKKVTIEYANSEAQFARSYFTKEYNISQDCFYKILELAIVQNLVSDDEVERMERKAFLNQKNHSVAAGISTALHYSELKKKRNEYIISMYSDKEIEMLSEDFAYSKLSKEEFTKEHGITTKTLDQLLKKAIVECIVDDLTFIAIKERSLRVNSSERAKKFFETLFEERIKYLHEELLSK